MFTHEPTTPLRVEILLELVWEMRHRKLDKGSIHKFLQPNGLPGLNLTSDQAYKTIKAAEELGLIDKDNDGSYRPSWNVRKPFAARDILLSAIDDKVLSSTSIEPWFARFFSYVINQKDDVVGLGSTEGDKWSAGFNRDLYGTTPEQNPFNGTKFIGLRRWMRYAGLGWHDTEDNFIPSPYSRVRRKLGDIFGKKGKLFSDEFMSSLGTHCPELDNGAIFNEVNKGVDMNRTCTRAISTALRDLHDDKIIRLDCPKDSRGWDLIRSGSIRKPQERLFSDKFDYVEVLH